LLKLHRKRHWLLNTHSYVVAFPATDGGVWVAIVIAGFCRRLARAADLEQLAVALRADTALAPSSRVGHFDADASTILAHWIRRPAEEHGLSITDLDIEDLDAALASLHESLRSRFPSR
jgi:hypothetical protein